MRTFKITVAYDGSGFHGWQIQPGVPTIQGALVDASQRITQEKIYLHGASRTDAGVHALGQVAHFRSRSALSALEFQRALNALLPPTIRVADVEETGQDFHARWNAVAKTYHYRIHRGRVLSPFDWMRTLHYPWPLDESAMSEAARFFEGEHDFSSFAASTDSDDGERNPLRVIYRSEILRRQVTSGVDLEAEQAACEIVYVVRGKSFLRYMVRKIVGTLLDVGRGRILPAQIPEIMAMKDRRRSGPTAPPEGLYLTSLEYPDVWSTESWRAGVAAVSVSADRAAPAKRGVRPDRSGRTPGPSGEPSP
jgi:tRNA pseudouridine38-40 synthase